MLTAALNAFRFATSFLTTLPVGRGPIAVDDKVKQRSLWFFPVVALVLGGLLVLVDAILRVKFESFVVGALDTLFLVIITGALHLDGVADTADGLFSHRGREDMLNIMRDSRIGTMGAVALIMTIILKIVVFTQLPNSVRGGTLFITPLAGRLAILVMMRYLAYARPEGGVGSMFGKPCYGQLGFGFALFVVVAFLFIGKPALLLIGLWVVMVALLCGFVHLKLKGYTGDTLGALSEWMELIPALAVMWAVSGSVV